MACVGIFDSGSGGLSVLKEILRLLPGERYVYYSDNAYCPYGGKGRDYVIDRSKFITEELLKRGVDIIVVACNTATSAAISTLRKSWPNTPFVGMEPAVKPAAKMSKSGVIGVLATEGTLKGEKYRLSKDNYASGVKVVEGVGRGFVELVESGQVSGLEVEKIVSSSLMPLLNAGADVIVLGCTHYPFLLPVMKRIAGEGVTFIDPAPAVARRVVSVLGERGVKLDNYANASIEIKSSGSDETVRRLLKSII